MRVYFLSSRRAALRLNGEFLGVIDGFERYVEIGAGQKPFCEMVPDGEFMPVAFFVDEKLLLEPPKCLDIYRAGNDTYIFAREYAPANGEIRVIEQRRFLNVLITLFTHGRVYLSVDGAQFTLTTLPLPFAEPEFEEILINGKPVLKIGAGGFLVLISDSGGIIFKNRAEFVKSDVYLEVTVPFETCAQCRAECSYAYDGEKLTLYKSVTKEKRAPLPAVVHFAFFEAVLTRGQYAKYLADELKEKAGDLPAYLGDFVGVCVPPSRYFENHPEEKAAGLIYPRAENVFDVKIYAVQTDGGLITNIYPVED